LGILCSRRTGIAGSDRLADLQATYLVIEVDGTNEEPNVLVWTAFHSTVHGALSAILYVTI
jgi:hypothetical protein